MVRFAKLLVRDAIARMGTITEQFMSLAAARTFLRSIEGACIYYRGYRVRDDDDSRRLAVADVYDRGYQWNRRRFLPALKVVAQSSRKADRFQSAVGYYVLGDVHFSNDAPRAAVRAYLRSARLWPTSGSAWREISDEYEAIGQHEKALRAMRKAVRIDPTDDIAVSDLESREEFALAKPLYRAGDPFWESSELLASSRHRQAIAVIAGKRSARADLYRARAYGAAGDAPHVLDMWAAVANQKGRVEIESADWFFLPPVVWHNAEFWNVLSRLAPRIESWSFLKGHDSLEKEGIYGRERFELFLRYHLSRTQRNLSAARELSERYSQWKEAVALVRSLKTRNSKKGSGQR
jgi:tetratricopeptide (TPR) repeat protein